MQLLRLVLIILIQFMACLSNKVMSNELFNNLELKEFNVENGEITTENNNLVDEAIYIIKCNLNYKLNSNSSRVYYDYNLNKWLPKNGYLANNMPLCASKLFKYRPI